MRILFYTFLFFTTLSCAGGGSGGTGILSVAGTLVDTSEQPVFGIEVRASTMRSSSSAISNEDGTYELIEVIREDIEDIEFSFESESINASFVVKVLPKEAKEFTATWQLLDNSTVTPIRYEFKLENGEIKVIEFD